MGNQMATEAALRAAVAERVGDARFGLWFGEGVRLGVEGDALEVGVPNAFFREWIRGTSPRTWPRRPRPSRGVPCG
jgi:chromosomal replication initiator protein